MTLDRRHMGGLDELSTNRVKSRHCNAPSLKKYLYIASFELTALFYIILMRILTYIISYKVIFSNYLAFSIYHVDFFLFKDLKFSQLYLKYSEKYIFYRKYDRNIL